MYTCIYTWMSASDSTIVQASYVSIRVCGLFWNGTLENVAVGGVCF